MCCQLLSPDITKCFTLLPDSILGFRQCIILVICEQKTTSQSVLSSDFDIFRIMSHSLFLYIYKQNQNITGHTRVIHKFRIRLSFNSAWLKYLLKIRFISKGMSAYITHYISEVPRYARLQLLTSNLKTGRQIS